MTRADHQAAGKHYAAAVTAPRQQPRQIILICTVVENVGDTNEGPFARIPRLLDIAELADAQDR